MGADSNLFLVAFSGKNAADFYSQQEKTDEMRGDETKELVAKTLACVRKFESKTGWIRPDLSYLPKAEETTAK